MPPINQNDVNPRYWYGEKDNLLILLALIKNQKLQLSRETRGIILNEHNFIHSISGYSFTLGLDFIVGTNAEEMTSKLDLLATELGHIQAWNKLQLSNNRSDLVIKKHKILFPTNLYKMHWVTLELVLQFDQIGTEFLLNKDIIANVYDSAAMCGDNTIARIHKMLEKFLQKFKQQDMSFTTTGKMIATKQQPDGNSCGPLTCKTIIDLINGKVVLKQSDSYSASEIIKLRFNHLVAVDDSEFTSRQKNYVEAILRAKKINGDIYKQAECINAYIIKNFPEQCNEIKDSLCKLVAVDTAIQITNAATTPLAVAEYETLDKQYKEQLTVVKTWFQKNYEPLVQLNLLQNIFETPANRQPDAELRWATDGKDTLVEVLKTLHKLPELRAQKERVEEQKDIAKKEREELERPQVAKEQTEQEQCAKLIRLNCSNYTSFGYSESYTYSGTITEDGKPHSMQDYCNTGMDTDLCCEALGQHYKYKGMFRAGKKVKFGVEEYHHKQLLTQASFVGVRGQDSKPLCGTIVCFVGNRMTNDYFLVYSGEILDGKPVGNGKLQMINDKHHLKPIDVKFNGSTFVLYECLSSLKIGINSREDMLFEHLKIVASHEDENERQGKTKATKYRQLLADMKKTLAIIEDHIRGNIGNLIIVTAEQEAAIIKAREAIISEYLKKKVASQPRSQALTHSWRGYEHSEDEHDPNRYTRKYGSLGPDMY